MTLLTAVKLALSLFKNLDTLSFSLSIRKLNIYGDIANVLGSNSFLDIHAWSKKVGLEGPGSIYAYKEIQNFSLVFLSRVIF